MTSNCRFSLLVILFSITTPPLFGQTTEDPLEISLDSVEVKATHSAIGSVEAPLSLSLFNTSRDFDSRTDLTLDQMTNELPGIWVKDRENYALEENITVRGLGWRAAFGVRGIQVLLDDIPLTFADGQAILTVVDPSFIERVELIRGPSSAFWGNSSGGVLHLTTQNSDTPGSSYKFKGSAGSYGLKRGDINISHNTENHNVTGYTSYMQQDGYRQHSGVKLGRTALSGSVDFDSGNSLSYMGAFATMPQAQHPGGLTADEVEENPQQPNGLFEQLDAGKTALQGQLGVSYAHDTGAGLLTSTLYGITRNFENPLPFGIIDVNRISGGGRFTYQQQFNDLDLNVGIDIKSQRDDREEYANDNGSRGEIDVDQVEYVTNYSAFLTSGYSMDALNLTAGLRYDYLQFRADAPTTVDSGDRVFQALNPTLGISYNTGLNKIYSNISTSFEAPTTTELVNRPDGGNGFNPDIDQERIIGLESGIRGVWDIEGSSALSYDVALYHLWIRDLLMPYQEEANGPTFYRNQGETRHYGLEAVADYRFSDNLSAGLSYNLIFAHFKDARDADGASLNNNDVPGIPNHRLNPFLKYFTGSVDLNLDGEYTSGLFVNNENTLKNDRYLLLNTEISYRGLQFSSGSRLVPFLAINNLLNTRYNASIVANAQGERYFEPSAGIHFQAGVTLSIQ